jgi:peroxiredoxin
MKSRRPLFLGLAILGAFALSALTLVAQQRQNLAAAGDTTSLEGKPAPDFTMQTLDGKSVKLSDQKGSVVLMDFWATWCPPCRKSLPHVQKLSDDKGLATKGLKVWAVNAQETKDKAQKFVDENKYSFTVPMDASGAAMKEYLITGIPTTIIVGRDGVIKKVFIGYGGEESDKEMEKALTEALNQAGPAT